MQIQMWCVDEYIYDLFSEREYKSILLSSIFQTTKTTKKQIIMALNNIPSSIQTLLNNVTKSEKRLNIYHLKMSAEVENNIAIFSEVKSELRKHLSCSAANQGNVRNYTYMSRGKILETF